MNALIKILIYDIANLVCVVFVSDLPDSMSSGNMAALHADDYKTSMIINGA